MHTPPSLVLVFPHWPLIGSHEQNTATARTVAGNSLAWRLATETGSECAHPDV